jgi:hypothetical protein
MTVSADDIDPDFSALATEARRLEPRVISVSTRTKDFKTVLIIETAGLTTQEVRALSESLKAFRRQEDLVAEFLIVNTTGAVFMKKPDLPKGWPPE